MNLFEFATYVGSGSACLIVGIMLLTIMPKSSTETRLFSRIKRLVAYCAFLDVIVDILVIIMLYHQTDFFLLDSFFIPVIYYLQMLMMIFSLLSLIHSSIVTRRNIGLFALPVCILVPIYTVCFLLYDSDKISFVDHYAAFVASPVSIFFGKVLYLIIGGGFITSTYWLMSEIIVYRGKIDNYFSGKKRANGRKLEYITYAFFGYFILAAIDFIYSSPMLDSVLMIVNTAIFIFCTIIIFNLQNIFTEVRSAIDYQNKMHLSVKSLPEFATVQNILESQVEIPEPQIKSEFLEAVQTKTKIDLVILEWEQRADKPFFDEGITLTTVAQSMKISPRLLSDYLNKIYGINFNKWINNLRIEEVKQMIKEQPQITLTSLAQETGFTDSSAMSKIFKRIVGETPSSYRSRIHNGK